jgi:hypothetical protein
MCIERSAARVAALRGSDGNDKIVKILFAAVFQYGRTVRYCSARRS